MANSLSNMQREAFEVFEETLSQAGADILRMGPVLTNDEAQLTLQTAQSGGGFTAYTAPGTNVTKDVLSGKVTFTSSPKAKIEKLRWVDLKDNKNLLNDRVVSMANRAVADIASIATAGLESLFSANHPLAGTSAGQAGSSKKYLDTGMGVGSVSQSNLFTQALSRSSVIGGIETLRNWVSWGDATKLNLGGAGSDLCLVVGPQNEDLAMQLVGSAVASSENQMNYLNGRIKDVIVTPFGDGDDAFLIDRTARPVGMWIREMPTVSVTPDSSQGNLDLIVSCKFIADFFYDVEGAGIIGYNVA